MLYTPFFMKTYYFLNITKQILLLHVLFNKIPFIIHVKRVKLNMFLKVIKKSAL